MSITVKVQSVRVPEAELQREKKTSPKIKEKVINAVHHFFHSRFGIAFSCCIAALPLVVGALAFGAIVVLTGSFLAATGSLVATFVATAFIVQAIFTIQKKTDHYLFEQARQKGENFIYKKI